MIRREFVTDILDESQQNDAPNIIVHFLASKNVTSVKAEFGFDVERDLRGEKQGEDAFVPLAELQQFIQRGLT
jgi:hypothetical protein